MLPENVNMRIVKNYLLMHWLDLMNTERKKMNIRFTDEIHKALVERANREDKSAAALVSELITAFLNREEPNDRKETSCKLC
ncbi:hypothetical protein BBB57_22875 [Kosakonia sacchari]|nr:hypothetical protein BBB57_22875 [Kosakonia sacchari]